MTEEFRKEEPLAATTVEGIKPGLKYRCIEGKWESLKDVGAAKPIERGTTRELDINKGGKEEYYAVLFTGFLNIPITGQYRFTLDADDGGALMLGGKTVCAKEHFSHRPAEGNILLEKGLHPFKLMYFQGYGGRYLRLWISGPDGKRRRVSGEMLFHK
jgi:hypothetical protein